MTQEEFVNLFSKGLFRHALLALAESSKRRSGVTLAQKLDSYSRNRMIRGIDSKSATHQEIKCVLDELNKGASKLGYEEMLSRL